MYGLPDYFHLGTLHFQLGILAVFLTVGYLIYYFVKKPYKYLVLVVLSLLGAGLISGLLALMLVYAAIVCFFFGKWLAKGRGTFKAIDGNSGLGKEEKMGLKAKRKRQENWKAALAVTLLLLPLFFFKYLGMVASWFGSRLSFVLLPLGISYYTLSAIGYLLDIKRGQSSAERNPLKMLLFVSYFPFLEEGPFTRYRDIAPTLLKGQVTLSYDNYISGLLKIGFGLMKKLVIADRLGLFVSATLNLNNGYGSYLVVLGVVAFTFQLYCEFSGLIEVVSGVSEIFGLKVPPNFSQPFFSTSVSEFWQRWHISLGAWFRDYLFYPLFMSKPMMGLTMRLKKSGPFFSSFPALCLTTLAVWALTGLWHGASLEFLLYGLYYGVLMCLEALFNHFLSKTKLAKTLPYRIAMGFVTFILVNIGMLLFKSRTWTDALSAFASMGKPANASFFALIEAPEFVVLVFALLLVLAVDILKEKNIPIAKLIVERPFFVRDLVIVLMVVGMVLFGVYGPGYAPADPIYGAF